MNSNFESVGLEAAVTGKAPAVRDTGRVKKRGADATTITLCISREDKALIRMLAEKNEASISDLLHQWIREHCKDE